MGIRKGKQKTAQPKPKRSLPEQDASIRELNLLKKQQMEAVRLLNDWSKWIVTLETAAIAGIVTWLKPGLADHLRGWKMAPDILLLLAAVFFAASIYYAAQLLFSLPDIVEQLPDAEEISINEMSGNYMGAGLLHYEKRQWLLFVCGLVLVILGAVAMVVVNLDAA
jgi:hypothetical protein